MYINTVSIQTDNRCWFLPNQLATVFDLSMSTLQLFSLLPPQIQVPHVGYETGARLKPSAETRKLHGSSGRRSEDEYEMWN